MQITVEPDSLGVHQSMLRDPHTGDWRKNDFLWHGLVNLKWEDKRLPFYVSSRSNVDEDSEREEWTARLLGAAVKAAGDSRLSAFCDNDLTNKVTEKLTSKNESQTISVSDNFFSKLEKEFELFQVARKSFKYAVNKVEAGVASLPYGGSSEINIWLSFIERMLECGYIGYEYGWYREKMGGIRTYVSDLAKRKNTNHPNFKFGLEYIKSNLFCFSPPAAWQERPPMVSEAELAQMV